MNDFDIKRKQGNIIVEQSVEKRKFIEKHSLLFTEKMFMVTMKENSFPRKICGRQIILE